MKNLIIPVLILMAIHATAYCDQTSELAIADSLYKATHYLLAIEAYTVLLDGDHADYALYKRGMALCPNCHRWAHYGADGAKYNRRLTETMRNIEEKA
ncbi:hypothetical protein ACFL30_01115 [Candidatus Latescibacterota bacterium]